MKLCDIKKAVQSQARDAWRGVAYVARILLTNASAQWPAKRRRS